MAASNHRVHEHDSVHHVMSRIAHRVYFLEEEERNEFVDIMRRAADYCGITLLAWCVMTNHFHILIYLPPNAELPEGEILRRYGVLKGRSALQAVKLQLAAWHRNGDLGEKRVADWYGSQRRRMYDIGEFMKIIKQWFTEEYNRRHSHKGTLWESAYSDKPVKMSVPEMSKRMGYIHLNPVRAAVTAEFDGYAWSSFYALVSGDKVAESGLRFAYNDRKSPLGKLTERHRRLLEELLESEKLKRAEEIVRRRAQGYSVPKDHLTTEAMIAQVAAERDNMRRALEELRIKSERGDMSRKERGVLDAQAVIGQVKLHPDISVAALADALGVAVSTMYKYLSGLKKKGKIGREGERWEVYSV